MKKALGQTVRDLKRGVNKKVLKVPSIERKVLDATSNEPWGPHGSLLADIAHGTRNQQEYQIIMSVLWKRINDTGKNWRHVYKALTVLEYLVAYGSERVIDDIKEHAHQISTLSDFQYVDSRGKDQGDNVRKKSQTLVVLVNDKERIQEVRQKAEANRDKFRNSSGGSNHRPGYDDRYEGRYGSRYDDGNGYGRDDERYRRNGQPYGREGDGYNRDSEERYGRDEYRDDDHHGRGQSSRSRSADRERDHAYEDDSQYSSRGSGAKADDQSLDGSTSGKRPERKSVEQNAGAPPSYEEAVGTSRSPTYSERDGESSVTSAPKASSPGGASPSHETVANPPPVLTSPPAPASTQATAQNSEKEVDSFDEFDPRGSFSAAPAMPNGTPPATSGGLELDLFGSFSDSLSSNPMALVPANEHTTSEGSAPVNLGSGQPFADASSAPATANQPFDDPFGDGPFRALPSTDTVAAQQQNPTSTNSFSANASQTFDMLQVPQKAATDFEAAFSDANFTASGPSGVQPPLTNPQFVQHEFSTPNQDIDILADILPPTSSPSFVNSTSYPVPAGQSVSEAGFPPQATELSSPWGPPSLPGQNAPQNGFQAQNNHPATFATQHVHPSSQTNYPVHAAQSVPQTNFLSQATATNPQYRAIQAPQMGGQSQSGQPASFAQPNPPNSNFYGAYHSQMVSSAPAGAHMVNPGSGGQFAQHNFGPQSGPAFSVAPQMGPQSPQVQPSIPIAPASSLPASTMSSAIVPVSSNDKFETKSTVWADTLSRGLVNLNISGNKTNPLNDIGVDFDAINRREKRMEKPTTATVTSTITMGKAMGSGSGMGRAGAGAIRPQQNPMMGPGMTLATPGGPGAGMNMGGYGVNQSMGRGPGMPGNMVPGMNMGMSQGMHMQQQGGYPPGSTMPGGYNPMMGQGNYGQQPYNGAYPGQQPYNGGQQPYNGGQQPYNGGYHGQQPYNGGYR